MNKENKNDNFILISMEEYKELLIIKGKYEELKESQKPYIQELDLMVNQLLNQ